MTHDHQPLLKAHQSRKSEHVKFLTVMAGAGISVAAAFVLGVLTQTSPFGQFSIDVSGILTGFFGTGPLLAFLYWFSQTGHVKLKAFRESQIDFFANIGFRFTPVRIGLLALAAGVSEEMLFRGVLQEWASRHFPIFLAVILPNILFGALHWRSFTYALIAGAVGVYLGVIFVLSGNLLAPILTHTLYDIAALEYTRRAVDRRHKN